MTTTKMTVIIMMIMLMVTDDDNGDNNAVGDVGEEVLLAFFERGRSLFALDLQRGHGLQRYHGDQAGLRAA